jgi:hypothetical protein
VERIFREPKTELSKQAARPDGLEKAAFCGQAGLGFIETSAMASFLPRRSGCRRWACLTPPIEQRAKETSRQAETVESRPAEAVSNFVLSTAAVG